MSNSPSPLAHGQKSVRSTFSMGATYSVEIYVSDGAAANDLLKRFQVHS